MSGEIANALIALLAAMLIVAAVGDIRARIIPNRLNLAIALLAIPYWIASGHAIWPEMATQVALAFGVTALFAGFFAIGAMGGGDVKLLGALALWLPIGSIVKLIVVMSLAGGVLTLVLLLRHRAIRCDRPLEIPYGVAIAFSGFWLIGERFLYQFG